MTNKEFQEKLKQYPDNIEVFVDTNFGWNIPNNTGYVEPYIYSHSYEGDPIWGIEIAPEDYAPMNLETIEQIIEIVKNVGLINNINKQDIELIYNTFNKKFQ